jgi:hypothetical protein
MHKHQAKNINDSNKLLKGKWPEVAQRIHKNEKMKPAPSAKNLFPKFQFVFAVEEFVKANELVLLILFAFSNKSKELTKNVSPQYISMDKNKVIKENFTVKFSTI